MKFSILTVLAAGTALVSASPLRVTVIGSEVLSSNGSLRFGHAMAPTNAPKITMVVGTNGPLRTPELKMKGGCRGSRFRQKAIEFSNTVRKALGLPLIEDHPVHVDEGRVRILPFIGTPNVVEIERDYYIAHPRPHHGSHVGFRQRLANKPFIHRLHVALMALGPWEGRAVAFVLGCGIGVLLRMVWVLAIVMYRLVKGPTPEEREYTEILFVEEIADSESSDAPPTYPYPDEKADKDKIQQTD